MSELTKLDKLDKFKFKGLKVAAVIGFFDGVHTGHLKIIKLCAKRAKEIGGVSVVFTFDKPPVNILKGKLDKKLITSYSDKIKLIKKIGVNHIVVAKFDKDFANLEPYVFCGDILADKLNAKEIFIGSGFKFGKDSSGNADFLKKFFSIEKPDVNINEVDIYRINQTPVSSTEIRKLYSDGDIENIVRFLGRRPSIKGVVIKGDQRGRIIGFPTANIDVFEKYITLKDGVYAGFVNISGRFKESSSCPGKKAYNYFRKLPSLINIGKNPTFKGNRKWIESHILNFNSDIYGKNIEIIFLKRLRDEIKFKNKDALIKQIRIDIMSAGQYFDGIDKEVF